MIFHRVLGRLASQSAGVRAAGLYAVGLAWTKGIALLMVPILTRSLAPAEFGRLEVLSSIAEIGGLLAGAGLVDTLYRFASGARPGALRAAAQVSGLSILVALSGMLLLGLFAGRIAVQMPLPTPPTQILLLGVAVVLESAITVPLSWMRMNSAAGAYTAVIVLRATIQSGLVAALVLGGYGVSGVLAAGAITAFGTATLLAAWQARRTGIAVMPTAPNRHAWRGMLAYGLPLVGGGLASFVLGTADRLLLAGTVPDAALGQYALAAKFAMLAALLTQPFELWWFPRRIGLLNEPEGKAQSARLAGVGATLVILSAAMAAIAGPQLIFLLTPAAYHPAALLVPFLCASLAMQSLGSLFNVGCYATRTGTTAMLVNSLAAAVAMVFYLLLIPRWGVPGAIAATLVAQATRLGVFTLVSQRRVPLPYPFGALLRLSGVAIVAAALPQVLEPGLASALATLAGLGLTGAMAFAPGLLVLPAKLRLAKPLRAAQADA